MQRSHPVAVLGAGPIGLAAAARLAERGQPFEVFEAGAHAGAAIREWAHVRLFSPWRLTIDPASRHLLERDGWLAPVLDEHPTGAELLERYLEPLSKVPRIAEHLHLGARVTKVTRAGVDKVIEDRAGVPFVVTVATSEGIRQHLASAVIDATGTWSHPNPLGSGGSPAPGETEASARITYGIPDVLGVDRDRYVDRRVAVVGSGHSAQNLARDLAELAQDGTPMQVTWVLRRTDTTRVFGVPSAELLPERGRLGSEARHAVESGRVRLETGFRTAEVLADRGKVALRGLDGRVLGPFDEVIAATGFRPDLGMLDELRVDVDPSLDSARALAPMIDPNVHSCGTVPPHGEAHLRHPEPDLYVVGSKSYGRAPTFLLLTGYEQVRSIVAHLSGDHDAAQRTELVLPNLEACAPPQREDCGVASWSDEPTAVQGSSGPPCCG